MYAFHFSLDPRGFKVENIRKLDEEEKLEFGDSDDEEFRVALPLKKNKPKKVRNYKNKMENWENAEVLSFAILSVVITSGLSNIRFNIYLFIYLFIVTALLQFGAVQALY